MFLKKGLRYETQALKLRDGGLDFPHGKRNKIILCARELDQLLARKVEEREQQEKLDKRLKELHGLPSKEAESERMQLM